ncbi:hypothetical protein CR513_11723, partial [Mucuna pruriens]
MLLELRQRLVESLKEYADVFAWSYRDMPGLDTTIMDHKLPLIPNVLRRMKPEMALKIKEEVEKQWNASFMVVAEYPQWVANIVLVSKKDGKVRMCVDYRDLNSASPKDNFPLPHIDMLTQECWCNISKGHGDPFHDMVHKEVKFYVDDMIAKSRMLDQHVEDLRKLFERL